MGINFRVRQCHEKRVASKFFALESIVQNISFPPGISCRNIYMALNERMNKRVSFGALIFAVCLAKCANDLQNENKYGVCSQTCTQQGLPHVLFLVVFWRGDH